MDLLLPYYHEVREKFNKDRFQGLSFNALGLFVLHFLRDRSHSAIFGLDDLYQAGTLTDIHFRDLDSWDWSISRDLDRLDDIVDELDEYGELDDLEELGMPDKPNELDDQDQEEAPHPVAFTPDDLWSKLFEAVTGYDEETVSRVIRMAPSIVDDKIRAEAIRCYNPTIFNLLFGHYAQVCGRSPLAPLCLGAEDEIMDAFKEFLVRGAYPRLKSWDHGWTPLAIAAYRGHFEAVRYLVEEQYANTHGSLTHQPLWCAIANGHSQIVDYLLASGADVFNGYLPPTCTQPALSWEDKIALREFLRREFNQTGEWNYRDEFKRLIHKCCARTRYILLSKAAADGDLDLVKYMVPFGVDVNSVTEESPLYHATEHRRRDVVSFLLGHATNLRPADVSDLLWCAAKNKDLDIIYLLLGCGPQLCPTLLSELLSVTAGSGNRYRSKSDGNAHDGLSMCLPKDGSFAERAFFLVSDRLYLGAWQLYKHPCVL